MDRAKEGSPSMVRAPCRAPRAPPRRAAGRGVLERIARTREGDQGEEIPRDDDQHERKDQHLGA